MYELVVLACIVSSPISKPSCSESDAMMITVLRGYDAPRCIAAHDRLLTMLNASADGSTRSTIICRLTGSGDA